MRDRHYQFDIIDNMDACKDSRDCLTLNVQRHRKPVKEGDRLVETLHVHRQTSIMDRLTIDEDA